MTAPPLPSLPEGTVALLFSDIEGSTRLVQSLGSEWAGVLDRSRVLCRDAWAAHGGIELGTEGDSFFVVFASTTDAVTAAVAAQQALDAEPWPAGIRLRARIGIHTGEPQRHGEGYVGLDVHLAARVASAAHGGQVLISAATAALVATRLPTGVGLIALGEHQLKDIDDPVALTQLTIPGLQADFPPPRTQTVTGTLPPLATELVGRFGETTELAALLTAGERLITLTGPGGTGKTQLTIAAAHTVQAHFTGGVHFVALATATDPAGMWTGIAATLGLEPEHGTADGVTTALADHHALLVLDNLEQIPDAHEVVATLLDTLPGLQILASSRRNLGVAHEREHAVPPLDLDAAVQLFTHQAVRVQRRFTLAEANRGDVEAICVALDGLPLAVEIAASRVKLLTPAAIRKRLDTALDLTGADRGRPDRQRTIRQAIDWSYQLLDDDHQQLLAHLGVFVGGAQLDAVEAVIPDTLRDRIDTLDALSDLIDASLVQTTENHDGEPRFTLLETIRRYALDALDLRGETGAAFTGHARHYSDLAQQALQLAYAGGSEGIALFEQEKDNLDAAIDRVLRTTDVVPGSALLRVEQIQRVAAATHQYLIALRWGDRALMSAHARNDEAAALPCLARNGGCLLRLGRFDDAIAVGALVADLTQRLFSNGGVSAPAEVRQMLTMAAAVTGAAHLELGNVGAAADSVSSAWDLATGLDQRHRNFVLAVQLNLLEAEGRWAEAEHVLSRESSADADTVDEMAWFADRMARIEIHLGRPGAGCRRLRASREAMGDDPDDESLAWFAFHLAVALGPADPAACARALGAVDAYRSSHEFPINPQDERILEDDIAPIRAAISADSWQRAWQDGAEADLLTLVDELFASEFPEI